MAKNKKLTITVEIESFNTPQNFSFDNGCSGIDQLALWVIIKNLADKQINKILNA